MPEPVCMKDVEDALKTVKKSPGLDIEKYKQWNEMHGSA